MAGSRVQLLGGGGDDAGYFDSDADEVFDLNAVARLQVVADDRLRADPGHRNLTVRILDVREEHIPGHLPVDAHRLNPFQDSVSRSLQHGVPNA